MTLIASMPNALAMFRQRSPNRPAIRQMTLRPAATLLARAASRAPVPEAVSGRSGSSCGRRTADPRAPRPASRGTPACDDRSSAWPVRAGFLPAPASGQGSKTLLHVTDPLRIYGRCARFHCKDSSAAGLPISPEPSPPRLPTRIFFGFCWTRASLAKKLIIGYCEPSPPGCDCHETLPSSFRLFVGFVERAGPCRQPFCPARRGPKAGPTGSQVIAPSIKRLPGRFPLPRATRLMHRPTSASTAWRKPTAS